MERDITLSVTVTSDQDFVDTFERLSRIAAGEILGGHEARVYSFQPEDDE